MEIQTAAGGRGTKPCQAFSWTEISITGQSPELTALIAQITFALNHLPVNPRPSSFSPLSRGASVLRITSPCHLSTGGLFICSWSATTLHWISLRAWCVLYIRPRPDAKAYKDRYYSHLNHAEHIMHLFHLSY